MSNQYKIGEFSKYLGVTPEFLKHYEQYGLIPPSISESGYRYYSFEAASEVLECIKLRNWEFSLKEIRKIIQESNIEQIMELYEDKIEEMKQMVSFYQSVIDDYEMMKRWIETGANQHDWTIEKIEPIVFLPHTNKRDFEHDERIYKIMKQWVQWMPMVHSCQRIIDFRSSDQPEFQWGFSVPLRLAKKHGLMVGEPCRILESQRCLIIPLVRYTMMTLKGQTNCTEIADKIAKQYNLEIKGDVYREVFQYSHDKDGKQVQHCRLIVPLK